MTQKNPRERFLDQIDEARKNVAEWPEWMRDSTQVITPPLPVQLETRSGAQGKPGDDEPLTRW